MRLNVVGPFEAQAIQYRLASWFFVIATLGRIRTGRCRPNGADPGSAPSGPGSVIFRLFQS